MIEIKKAQPVDADPIWEILRETIRGGNTFVYPESWTKEEMLGYWLDPAKHTYVAWMDSQIVGTFFIQDNQPGRGSHIANAGYMTAPEHYGKGIARHMCRFSLAEARRLGYQAMQFNIVVKTNERAVALWQHLGFRIIGEIPEAFQHKEFGLVNAYIMYQKL
jgi:ribosomal protein S18 acetylase RimI-like enzyme